MISLTVTPSEVKSQNDIPKYLTATTDIISTIFYTFDGTDPTTDSFVYVDRIELPTQGSSVTIKTWATNGSESSEVVTSSYQFSFSNTSLRAYPKITNFDSSVGIDYFPFGGFSQPTPPVLGGVAGTVVRFEPTPPYPQVDGYDADGNPLYLTDQPLSDYLIVYSETDRLGQTGRGIGTLPNKVTIRLPNPIPEISSTTQKLFDPRAFVFLQSSSDPIDPNMSMVVHNQWTADDPRVPPTVYRGAYLGNTLSGSFLRQHWNPRDSTLNYYYFDSKNLKWIINKEHIPNPQSSDYSQIPVNPRNGIGMVFRWYSPFFANRGY